MRVAIAADHNGVAHKSRLVAWLTAAGHEVEDHGTHDDHEVVDYPPLCATVCDRVVAGHVDRAVVVGGSGSGETIACNKVRGIRAALCHSTWGAEVAGGNNDANVLVLGARVVSAELAEELLATWLRTPFRGGVHGRRLEQIAALEADQQRT